MEEEEEEEEEEITGSGAVQDVSLAGSGLRRPEFSACATGTEVVFEKNPPLDFGGASLFELWPSHDDGHIMRTHTGRFICAGGSRSQCD